MKLLREHLPAIVLLLLAVLVQAGASDLRGGVVLALAAVIWAVVLHCREVGRRGSRWR